MSQLYPKLSAAEAAEHVQDGQNVAFSGFTAAGAPKAVPKAIAERARKIHTAGNPFRIGVMTGASTGKSLDGSLAQADAVLFRTPYQSDPDLRKSINEGRTAFFDMHLSMMPQAVRYGFLGPVRWAVVEACDITSAGEITLTSSVGAAPTFCNVADQIIIELNRFHPASLRGFHDIYEPEDPPYRNPLPLFRPSDRIGSPTIKVNPKKILGIVETDAPDETGGFGEISATTARIGDNVANFLAGEIGRGLIPKSFLPIQSGVGDTANAVLHAMGQRSEIPMFEMYTEVIQDAVVALMKQGKVRFASGCSLTVTNTVLRDIYDSLEFFRSKILLRPQEITNSPEIVRRIGIISINTAIEVDITGNVNSTHVLGRSMMNGIGGSGDFARNAFLSIFTCPSTAKGGKISTIVPLVSHLDHSEHSVQIIVTEQGVADLRGKSPTERAKTIIDNCAHPDYRGILRDYVALAGNSHSPQTLSAAFGMHLVFGKTGDMRSVNWGDYK
ncbi:MAG TPA: acetyl-CoA hydrolase/transferase family protein [Verrucomicrobiae bacterium]|nr:acetyl-CoA hydrolase/transferase family protein [Verrucomicrobiae bacterium]